jgi:hypothetical protein
VNSLVGGMGGLSMQYGQQQMENMGGSPLDYYGTAQAQQQQRGGPIQQQQYGYNDYVGGRPSHQPGQQQQMPMMAPYRGDGQHQQRYYSNM